MSICPHDPVEQEYSPGTAEPDCRLCLGAIVNRLRIVAKAAKGEMEGFCCYEHYSGPSRSIERALKDLQPGDLG